MSAGLPIDRGSLDASVESAGIGTAFDMHASGWIGRMIDKWFEVEDLKISPQIMKCC
jgi:hypothetical protein